MHPNTSFLSSPGLRSIQRPHCTISRFLFIQYSYSSAYHMLLMLQLSESLGGERRNTADTQYIHCRRWKNNFFYIFTFLRVFFSLFLVEDDYWNHFWSVNCLLANARQKNMYWIINNILNIPGYLMVRAAFRYRFPYWSWMSAACLTLTQNQRARCILICAVGRLMGWCILAYQLQQKWSKTQHHHWWWWCD